MTRTNRRQLQSIIARLAVAALAMAGYLAVLPAAAGPGDLDPSFADTGRLVAIPSAAGEVHSIEADGTDGFFIAGHDYDVRRTHDHVTGGQRDICFHSNFAGQFDASGTLTASIGLSDVATVDAYAMARDPDGRIVVAGAEIGGPNLVRCRAPSKLVVSRLQTDGSLDTGFSDQGHFLWPDTGSLARSLLVEPDGRIVIAGFHTVVEGEDNSRTALLVVRLLADGSRDASFAAEGAYSGPDVSGGKTHVLRTSAGDYRVSAPSGETCRIVGLKADGTPDAAFGNAGTLDLRSAAGDSVTCDSIDLSSADALLIAGASNSRAFAARLLADGSVDTSFSTTPALADALERLTSIADDASGRIFVAGTASQRSAIMRMTAGGVLDATFGDGGLTWIDLPSVEASIPEVLTMLARSDGSMIVAGGDTVSDSPFVVRLLGDSDGDSPGVVGLAGAFAGLTERDGQAIARVRRTGGRDGDVSVTYRTLATGNAVAGEDFEATEGTLHWADGDTSEKEFAVTLVQDDDFPELEEYFAIELMDASGGAGLGTYHATVTVLPDGSPGGQVQIESASQGREGAVAYIILTRDFYAAGRVCVTFAARSGTATEGRDFEATSSLACWEDQIGGALQFEIRILEDDRGEARETFVVELSNPTGGAIIGEIASTTVSIPANASHGSGGGGPAGPVELLTLLGLLLMQRRVCRAIGLCA